MVGFSYTDIERKITLTIDGTVTGIYTIYAGITALSIVERVARVAVLVKIYYQLVR